MKADDSDSPLSRWLSGEGLEALDGLLGETADVVGVLDRDLAIRYLNWTVPGLSREAVIGNSVLTLVPPDQQDTAREVYTRVLATGVAAHFETMYKDGDGILLWEVRVGPIHVDGKVIGLTALTCNVTEQRRAYADRDRFFSLSLDMLVLVSPLGVLTRANPAFGEALGYGPAELIGRPIMDLVHVDDRERTAAIFEHVLGGSPVAEFENRYLRKDGAHRVFSWRGNVDPITRDIYAVARDVSEQRQIEAQLRHAQKMEAVGQLAGGVAHDFNNLLLAILANAELARTEPRSPGDVAEHLAEIENAARRAADLTKQLLTFSRQQPLRPTAVDLNDLLGKLMKMLRRLLPQSISITSTPGRDLAPVRGDAGQLEQVIVNLCVNARDAMEAGGRLSIETENLTLDSRYCETHPWATPGRYVRLSVTDTGTGMPPEVRERAFEPFFTTKAHQGTGLGLATVYGIVQQHEGMIQLYSEPGEGTTFRIYLPTDERLVTETAGAPQLAPPGGHEMILIAEDEELVRRVVVRVLERAGYRTIAVANGAEAVRVVREGKEPIALALLDIVMPNLGGPETWEQLKQLRPGLRVLFASGYADQRYRERLHPEAEVLEKPFHMDDLLRRVRTKLDGG